MKIMTEKMTITLDTFLKTNLNVYRNEIAKFNGIDSQHLESGEVITSAVLDFCLMTAEGTMAQTWLTVYH